jgi:hypothetical protein
MLGPKEEHFEVWPENWEAVQAFLTVQTQWAADFGGRSGLDYVRVRAGLEMAGVAVTTELFTQLRVIEAGALKTLAKQAQQQQRRK